MGEEDVIADILTMHDASRCFFERSWNLKLAW